MNRSLLVGLNAIFEIKKEQELDDTRVLRILVSKRPSGSKDVSFAFDNPCVADFIIRDNITHVPIIAIDKMSLTILQPKKYIIGFENGDFFLRESSFSNA